MSQKFYSDEDAEAILKLASRTSSDGPISRDKLYQSAAELGISQEAVDQAENALLSERRETGDRVAFEKEKRREFFANLGSFGVTAAILASIDYFTSGGFHWFYWVLIAWGFGIASDLNRTFNRGSADYQKAFRRWQRKRDKRQMGDQFGDISDLSDSEEQGTESGARLHVRLHN
jgi:hypothetical protein